MRLRSIRLLLLVAISLVIFGPNTGFCNDCGGQRKLANKAVKNHDKYLRLGYLLNKRIGLNDGFVRRKRSTYNTKIKQAEFEKTIPGANLLLLDSKIAWYREKLNLAEAAYTLKNRLLNEQLTTLRTKLSELEAERSFRVGELNSCLDATPSCDASANGC